VEVLFSARTGRPGGRRLRGTCGAAAALRAMNLRFLKDLGHPAFTLGK